MSRGALGEFLYPRGPVMAKSTRSDYFVLFLLSGAEFNMNNSGNRREQGGSCCEGGGGGREEPDTEG